MGPYGPSRFSVTDCTQAPTHAFQSGMRTGSVGNLPVSFFHTFSFQKTRRSRVRNRPHLLTQDRGESKYGKTLNFVTCASWLLLNLKMAPPHSGIILGAFHITPKVSGCGVQWRTVGLDSDNSTQPVRQQGSLAWLSISAPPSTKSKS